MVSATVWWEHKVNKLFKSGNQTKINHQEVIFINLTTNRTRRVKTLLQNTGALVELCVSHLSVALYRRGDSITLLMKLTMAEAGCSGSNSANRWQTFSAKLPGFLATKPNTLEKEKLPKEVRKN